MEGAWGAPGAEVVLRPAPGVAPGAVDLVSINVKNSSYIFFKDISFKQRSPYGGGDVVHFEACDYVHLLGVTIKGKPGARPQEALKVNQVVGMYLEDSRLSVAEDNVLDFVAVSFGHVCRSDVSLGNWCAYVKGGSAFLLIDGNRVADCGEAALRVGQGTGFEYMSAPFLNYEAYGVVATNNLVLRSWGAALGVAGGYDVVFAHNTVHRFASLFAR